MLGFDSKQGTLWLFSESRYRVSLQESHGGCVLTEGDPKKGGFAFRTAKVDRVMARSRSTRASRDGRRGRSKPRTGVKAETGGLGGGGKRDASPGEKMAAGFAWAFSPCFWLNIQANMVMSLHAKNGCWCRFVSNLGSIGRS